jgi:hypothetical protein
MEKGHTLSLPGVEPRLFRPVLFSASCCNTAFEIIAVFSLLVLGVTSSLVIVVNPAVEFLGDVGCFADVSDVHTTSS